MTQFHKILLLYIAQSFSYASIPQKLMSISKVPTQNSPLRSVDNSFVRICHHLEERKSLIFRSYCHRRRSSGWPYDDEKVNIVPRDISTKFHFYGFEIFLSLPYSVFEALLFVFRNCVDMFRKELDFGQNEVLAVFSGLIPLYPDCLVELMHCHKMGKGQTD